MSPPSTSAAFIQLVRHDSLMPKSIRAGLDPCTCLLGEAGPSVVAENSVRRQPDVYESGSAVAPAGDE
jgi:hypothetical protein